MNLNDHHLIQQVLDGDVSREEFDAFQERLRNEPDLLSMYGEYALLQHSLCEEFEGGDAAHIRPTASRLRVFSAPSLIAIAAVLAFFAVVWISQPWVDRGARQDVALLTFSVDAVWKVEGSSNPIGGAMGVGKDSVLRLEYGRAGISLSPTVSAMVEGPAELIIRSADSISMKSGKGFFVVGGSGGLKLDTPKTTAADFGAEFGIEITESGDEEILVSSGEMRAIAKADDAKAVLASGEAVQIRASGLMETIPGADRRFAKTLGRFRSIMSETGSPGQEGGTRTRFLHWPAPVAGSEDSVMLATLNLVGSSGVNAQGDKSSFVSLFSKGSEVLQLAKSPTGDRSENTLGNVTIRYDQRTGDVSIHKGSLPLGEVICSGKIPPGSEFDEIRLGESAGSDLAITGLDIRIGEDL